MRNAVRLAVGTLTVLPTRPPASLTAATWRRAITSAPLVGLVLGLLAGAVAWVLYRTAASSLLAAAGYVGMLAVLTRGLHLDGLADVADGLGSRRPPDAAREVMRRSDVGPFGVISLVLVLLVQVAALQVVLTNGLTWTAWVVCVGAAVVARSAIVSACRHEIPAAPDGIGAHVVGTVPAPTMVITSLVTVVALGALGVVQSTRDGLAFAGAAAIALVATELWRRHCSRRLGGVTGDVLGSVEELAFTAFVLLAAVLG